MSNFTNIFTEINQATRGSSGYLNGLQGGRSDERN